MYGQCNTMQHFQALGNTKLPLRSASCYCGLSCVVPSPPSCPSASHGGKYYLLDWILDSGLDWTLDSGLDSRLDSNAGKVY